MNEEEDQGDPIAELREKMAPLSEYDYRALMLYQAYSFYVAQRAEGMDPAPASQLTCERFGHDAPRGLCLRCGLGADITREAEREKEQARTRLSERAQWLASRG